MTRTPWELSLLALETVLRLSLGGLFVWAAWSKLEDPALFAVQVAAYDILPQTVVLLVALVLPPLELLTGCMLVLTKWSREAAFVVTGMLAVFIVALAQAAVRGLDISCGCFADELADHGPSAILVALIRDVVLLVPSIWLLIRPNRPLWRTSR